MKHVKWIFLLLLASVVGAPLFVVAFNQLSDTKPVVALISGTATAVDIANILFGHISAAAISAAVLGFPLGLLASKRPKLLGFAAGCLSSAILLTFYFKPPTSIKLSIYSIELFGLLVFTLVCTVCSLIGYRLKSREA
jgi:hypothetical protein